MPKPDSEKLRHVKSKVASRAASARVGAQIIAMVPRQHAAPLTGAAAATSGFAASPAPDAWRRREQSGVSPLFTHASIAIVGFLLGALVCYVTLDYRGGRIADMSAGGATLTAGHVSRHAK